MSLSADQSNAFLSAYSFVKRTRFLETPLGRRLFRSAYFLYKRYVEDNLQELVQAFPALVGGGNVLDIGANLGYTAAVLARAAAPNAKVYAFEPEPFNFRILRQTALKRTFNGRIVPLQLAVGAENGTISLWINDHHHADHRVVTEQFHSAHLGSKQVSVPLVSVDGFLESHPGEVSFVKIDVQGYELAVCRGMERTLRQNPGLTVLLEYMPSAMHELGFDPSQLIGFFTEREFRIYQVHPRGRLVTGIPADLKDSEYIDLLFTRHSVA
jgi:FkbM family methyltransferase